MRTTSPRILAGFLIMAVVGLAMRGDDDPARARGFSAGSMYQFNDIDTIDTFNGNLMLSVPVGPKYKTNGVLQYQFRVFYNSNIWEHRPVEAITTEETIVGPQYGQPRHYNWFDEDFDPGNGGANNVGSEAFPARFNAGFGWLFSLTGAIDVAHNPSTANPYHYVSYQTPDGAWHPFTPRLHGDITNIAASEFTRDVYYTRDGTYMRSTRLPNGRDYIIDKPDGTRERFICVERCAQTDTFPEHVLDQISDAFGNVVYVQRSGNTETYIEAVGVGAYLDHNTAALTQVRSHTVQFGAGSDCVNPKRVTSVTVAGPPGAGSAVYTFHYDDARIFRSREMFWGENSYLLCPFDANSGEGTKMFVRLLRRIESPNARPGSSSDDWTFDYIIDPRSPEHTDDYEEDVVPKTWGGVTWEASYVSGRLYKVNLPTGGSIRYKYERRPFRKVPTTCQVAKLGITAVGVRERQVLKRDGNADGDPWRYFRGNVSVGGTFTWCSSSEILSLTVDPLGNTTASFFMATADRDWGQPFLRGVPDTDGTRFLSSQTFKCNRSDFVGIKAGAPKVNAENTEPFGSPKIRRVVRRYTESNLSNTTCGAPLRSTYVQYESSGEDCNFDVPGDCVQANKRAVAERTIYHDDGNTFTTVNRSDFDGFGHYRTETTGGNLQATNFGSGSDQRVSLTNFNPGVVFSNNTFTFPAGYTLDGYPWPRISTYDLQVRTEGSASANMLFRFDENTGFLQRKRTLATSSACSQSAQKYAQCGTGGALLKPHDVLHDYKRSQNASGETQIIESWYGGDGGQLSQSVDLSTIGGNPEYLTRTNAQYGAVKKVTHLTCGEGDFLTTEQNVVDASSGLITSSRDSSGATTSYEYDALFRVTKIDPPGSDPATEYTYHNAGPNTGPYVDITTSSLKTSRVEWDHLGRVHMERNHVPDANGALQESATLTWYTPNGWKEYESTVGPAASGPNQSAGVSFFEYDAFGRAVQIQHPDHVGGGDGSGKRKTVFEYSGIRLVTEKTVDGNAPPSPPVYRTYDRFGRLVRVNEPSIPGGIATTYAYDVQDHLIQVDSPNSQHRVFSYDRRGFLLSETHPELAGTTLYHSNYDPRGNAGLLLYSAPSSSARTKFDLSLSYDPAGRLLSVSPFVAPSNALALPLQEFNYYQQASPGVIPSSGGTNFLRAGKLQTAVRRNVIPDPARTDEPVTVTVTEAMLYDETTGGSTGRLNGKTTTAGGNTFTAGYAYNGLGLPATITYGSLKRTGQPDVAPATQVGFVYSEGALTTVTNYASRIGYNSNGTVGTVVHTNGTRDLFVPDPNLLPRPERITSTFVGSSTYNTGQYKYDVRGNITAIGFKTYAYDAVNRLTSANLSAGIGTQTFAYDANGNITSFAGMSLPVEAATNRLKTSGSWIASYDLAGNAEQWQDARRMDVKTTFSWDALNMLTHVRDQNQGKVHVYNASNERVATFDYRSAAPNIVETWSLRGLGDEVLRDFIRVRSASGTGSETWSWRDYIRRGGTPLAMVRSSSSGPETLHYHVDHLGSIRRLSNASGSVVDHRDFYPFGEEQQERADDNRVKFTGHERDDNGATHAFGDFDYMHARYYAPTVGRFLSLDPGRDVDIGMPQSWNLYAYVRNSPIGSTDPTGRESEAGGGSPVEVSTQRRWVNGEWVETQRVSYESGHQVVDEVSSMPTTAHTGNDVSVNGEVLPGFFSECTVKIEDERYQGDAEANPPVDPVMFAAHLGTGLALSAGEGMSATAFSQATGRDAVGHVEKVTLGKGGAPSMTWVTPAGKTMVRYISKSDYQAAQTLTYLYRTIFELGKTVGTQTVEGQLHGDH